MGDEGVAATPAGKVLLPGGEEVKFWSALFGLRKPIEAKLCWAAPEHAEADTLSNADKVKGRIAVVRRGLPPGAKKGMQCTFGDKTRRCVQAGAVGMIIVNSDDAPLAPGGYATQKIPIVCVHLSSGKKLVDNARVTLQFGLGKAAARIRGLMKMGVFSYASSSRSSSSGSQHPSQAGGEAPDRPRTTEEPLETRREEWPEGVYLQAYEPVGQLPRDEDAPLRNTRPRRGSIVRPLSPTSEEEAGVGSPRSSAWDASVGSPTMSDVAPDDEGQLEGEGAGFEYESKAQVLHSGITHKDPVMRRLAAEQLPSLCERRPVEGYVVERFLSLLDDGEWRVRRAAVDNLTSLCEVGDQAAVRAMIRRTWTDSSWTIRLGAVEVLGKIGNGKDPQILLALLGRMEDPEAARGGRFLVREAALGTILRLGTGGENVRVVMQRLKHEPWAERKAALQALMMASNDIPCSTDDQRHPQAPVRQGYPLQLNPIHEDEKLHEEQEDAENAALLALEPENLCLKNGYKPKRKQGVILPMQTNATWKPSPSGDGDWDAKVKFEVDGNGFDEGYWTENWGRHKTQTAESYMTAQLALRLKAERRAIEMGRVVKPPSKKKSRSITKDDIDLEDEANQERERVVLGVVPGIRDIRCTRLGEAPGTGVTRAMGRPKFYADEVLPGSLNTEGRKTIHNSRRSQQIAPTPVDQQTPSLVPNLAAAPPSQSPLVQGGKAAAEAMSGGESPHVAAGGGAGDTAVGAVGAEAVGEGVTLSKGTDELPGMVPAPGRVSPIRRISPGGRDSPSIGMSPARGRRLSTEASSARLRGTSVERTSASPARRKSMESPSFRVSPEGMPHGEVPALPEDVQGGGEAEKGGEATAALRAAMPKVGTQAAAVPAGKGVEVSRRDALLKGAMSHTFSNAPVARNRWRKASNASRVVVHLGKVSSRGSTPDHEGVAGFSVSPGSPGDEGGRAISPPVPRHLAEDGSFSPIPGMKPRSPGEQRPSSRPGSREGRDGSDEYEGSHLLANRKWQSEMASSREGTPPAGSPPGSRGGTPATGNRGSSPFAPPGSRGGSGSPAGALRSGGSLPMAIARGKRLGRMNSFALDKAMRQSPLSALSSPMPQEDWSGSRKSKQESPIAGRSGGLGQLDENSTGLEADLHNPAA
eukprot:CAMPEP_0173424006 /NCGR_PEP_ID=MMETSP1357-20121228/4061_1 /TAXON_ID=77926 /ORGANISM="Hemiselmis rufescens, Strain PCC563" /LENGTH=1151 /DNA_ID=CAMNT_0014387173 /DNA_START=165 /DNA_END=3620 /DNA_ORIENTATION=-